MSERMIHLNIYKGSTHLRLAIVNQCLAYSSTSHTCIIVFIVFIYHQEPLMSLYDLAIDHKAQADIKLYINILPFCLASDVRHILCTDKPFSRKCLFLLFNSWRY